MVATGLRFNKWTSAITEYIRSKDPNQIKEGNNANIQERKIKGCIDARRVSEHCICSFDDLIFSASSTFQEDLKKTMTKLRKSNNVLKLCAHGCDREVPPTYASSVLLNNSVHIDFNDASRRYTVFYRHKPDEGLAYFLLPKYSIAIKLGKTPILISCKGYQ